MYSLPISITINDTDYEIRNKGDYRMVLDCFSALDDAEITKQERILACLVIFYETFDDIQDAINDTNFDELVKQMFLFFNGGTEEVNGQKTNFKLVDWEKDETILVSAINHVAGKEVRAESYIHWWTFLAYYMGIGDCTFSHIINIRYKSAKGEKLEKHERKFKMENPQYFNIDTRLVDQKEEDLLIKQLWNSGK